MSRVLLLVDRRENRRLLASWLSRYYEVVQPDSEELPDESFDLCIADGSALERNWEWAKSRKELAQPVFQPFMLVTARQSVKVMTRHLWEVIDELAIMPIDKVELRARIEVLLRERRRSIELKRRFDEAISELQISTELASALNTINSAISATRNIDEILYRVAGESARAVGAEISAVFLRRDGFWVLRHVHGLPQELIGTQFSDEEAGTAIEDIKAGMPVVIGDVHRDRRVNLEVMKRYDVRSVMAAPLMVHNEAIGILFFGYHSTPTTFSQPQNDFAGKLAVSLSLALENARLFEAELKAKEQARYELEISGLLLQAADALAESVDLQGVLNSLADIIVRATGRNRVVASLYDEKADELTIVVSRGSDTFPIGMKISVSALAPQVRQSIIERRPVVVDYDVPDMPQESKKRAKAVNSRLSLSAPIVLRGEVIGHIGLDEPGVRREFTKRELNIIEGIAAQAAVAIENARLFESQRNIADTLQTALLTMPSRIEGVEFSYLYRSATEATRVGGDFYDIFELEHDRVGIVVGDVAGKGLEAATLTSLARNTIRAYAYQEASPAAIMTMVNNAVLKASRPGSFVTVFFAIVDLKSGTLTYCSAGHPPAVVTRGSKVSLLEAHSPIIGAFKGLVYEEAKATLKKGDIVVLYTDGITEARCDDGFFGETGLIATLEGMEPLPIRDIPQAIFNKVMACSEGKITDDIALLSLGLR